MSLASNHKDQMAKRLKADLELRGYSATIDLTAANDPLLTIKSGATKLAICQITRRSFNGFQVVAELSTSAAEGLPEHIAYLLVDSAASQLNTSKLAMFVKALGTSSMKLGFVVNASLTEANLTDANVAAEIGNDARSGASGQ